MAEDPYEPLPILDSVPERHLGKAMKKLSLPHRKFVWALVATMGNNRTAAYKAAFPDANDTTARTNGHKLWHQSDILEAFQEEAWRLLPAKAAKAALIIEHLADEATDEKVRLKAATTLAGIGGFVATQKIDVRHEHDLSQDTKERLAYAQALAARLGLDPKKVVGNVIDGEFSEVPSLPAPIAPPDEESFL